MKKRIGLAVVVVLAMGLVVGCNSSAKTTTNEMADSISFTATIDEVSDTELLVTVLDNDNFDQARVNMQGFDSLDFVPQKGQTIKLSIKNQVGMSEPPFVNPITIELAK
jgi:curli biogenesis system outer membrane secretion channel CsgG